MRKIKIPRQMGQVVKDRRVEMGITQAQLAELSNTSRSLIYRLEKGATNGVAFDKLFDVLNVLGLGLAVVDASDNTDNAPRIATDRIGGNCREERPEGQLSSPKVEAKMASKRESSQNQDAQLEKELEAMRNIKGFDVMRTLKD